MAKTPLFYWLHYDSRSGSTFLANKLTSQYKLYSPPEVNFIPKFLRCIDEHGFNAASKPLLVDLICKDPKHVDWLLNREVATQLLADLTDKASCLEILKAILQPLIVEIGEEPEVFLIKKKYLSSVSLIDRLIPNTRHFILVRDGRAVMHSKLSSIKSTTNRPFTTSVLKASVKWKAVIDHYHRLKHRENVFLVRYEDMITDVDYLQAFGKQHGLTKRSGEEKARYVLPERYSYGLHVNIDKPADPGIINKWKAECPPERVKLYEFLTKDYLRQNGYELEYQPSVFNVFRLLGDVGRLLSEMVKDSRRKI